MPNEKSLRAVKEDELEKLRSINAALEKLSEDQRKLFIQLAEPTDDLEAYEKSVRSFSDVVAGAEEALRNLTKGKLGGRPPSGGGGVGIGTGQGVGLGAGGGPGTGEKTGEPAGGGGQVGVGGGTKVAPNVAPGAGGTQVGGDAVVRGNPDDLQAKLEETWNSVDPKTWGKLDAKGREELARRIAGEQRNIQLKHMVTHPGETVKGMAEAVVRVDKLGKEVAKDIKDVADSSKSASARAAAAASAGKKISMWLSAIIVVATIIAFIFNPALTLKVWMLRAMALAIIGAALAATEAELRIQEAAGATDFAAFQEAVQKAGSAQAEFIATVAMAAIPLVGRLLGKVPFVAKIGGYIGKVVKLPASTLWAIRNAIAKELRDLIKGTEAAVRAEGAGYAKLAARLEKMTAKEFLEALKNEEDLREGLGFTDESFESLEELLDTPEGQNILDQLHKQLTRSIKDAPDIAQRFTEDYGVRLEEAAKKLENAKTADEVKAAVDEANRVLGENHAGKDLISRGEDYKGFRQAEAAEQARLEALEKEAAAHRAAAEKTAADKAAADTAAADKAAADTAAADKAAADTTVAGAEQSPLSEVKPSDVAEAIADEAKVDTSRRMSWDDAAAQKLDKRSIPADVKKAGLGNLWKEWVDYIRGRLKSQKQGLSPRRPLAWEAYRDFLGKFRRGRIFQEKFTAKLQGEVGKGKTVQQDVGVVSETLEKAVLEGKEGVKFADQVVTDDAAVKAYGEGKGPAPEVETFSNKSRDFRWHDKNGSLEDIVKADVQEVLTKYGGKITIRRPGQLQGVKVKVSKASLVYDASGLPSDLVEAVRDAFDLESHGRVTLRIE